MTKLKRSLNLPLLVFYGLGTILGAGIYVLTGVVAGSAGIYTPWSFLVAAIVASLTAFSYAELSAHYPKAAGEATYVKEAFGKPMLTKLIGWSLIIIGSVSAATIANGFVGYFNLFFALTPWIIIVVLVLMLGGLAAYGISESVWVTAGITLLEVLGLILVVGSAIPFISDKGMDWTFLTPDMSFAQLSGIYGGAFLAFYAFIGFEDMVNLAEETSNPEKNLPKAIIIAMVVSTFLYFLVAVVAIQSVPIDQLSGNTSPMTLIVESHGYFSPSVITAISLLAVVNGALVQIIMASRVLYGMSKMKRAPEVFQAVHPKTQTPLIATGLVTAIVLALALWFPLKTLAEITSAITLIVFFLVNASLLRLRKIKKIVRPYKYPALVPWLGSLTSLILLMSLFI